MSIFQTNSKQLGVVHGTIDRGQPYGAPRQVQVLGDVVIGQPVVLSALSTLAVTRVAPWTGQLRTNPHGVMVFDGLNTKFRAGSMGLMATQGMNIVVETSEPVVAGNLVTYDVTTGEYFPAAEGGISIGFAYNTTEKPRDMVRMQLLVPYYGVALQPSGVHEVVRSVTVADWALDSGTGDYFFNVSIAGTEIGEDFSASFIAVGGNVVQMTYKLVGTNVRVSSGYAIEGNCSIIG